MDATGDVAAVVLHGLKIAGMDLVEIAVDSVQFPLVSVVIFLFVCTEVD